MNAIYFPEVNVEVAKDQPEYNTLPSFVGPVYQDVLGVICCFELTEEEIKRIVQDKRIWHRTLTGGAPLQPFLMTVEKDYFANEVATEVFPPITSNYEFVKFKLTWKDWFKTLFSGKFTGCIRVEKKLFNIKDQSISIKPKNL